jgi:hypothetical protein
MDFILEIKVSDILKIVFIDSYFSRCAYWKNWIIRRQAVTDLSRDLSSIFYLYDIITNKKASCY